MPIAALDGARHLSKPGPGATVDPRFRSAACGLWYVAGKNQVLDACGGPPALTLAPKTTTSLAYAGDSARQGWGVGGDATLVTAESGAITPAGVAKALSDSTKSELTVVAVFWPMALAGRYNVLFRLDNTGASAYSVALDLPDANKLRLLIPTSATTGYTTAVDVTVTMEDTKAYVLVGRWRNGVALEYCLQPADGKGRVQWLTSPHTPTGVITTVGGSAGALKMHMAGWGGSSVTDNFGGLVFAAGWTAKALDDAYVAEIVRNPWGALLAPMDAAILPVPASITTGAAQQTAAAGVATQAVVRIVVSQQRAAVAAAAAAVARAAASSRLAVQASAAGRVVSARGVRSAPSAASAGVSSLRARLVALLAAVGVSSAVVRAARAVRAATASASVAMVHSVSAAKAAASAQAAALAKRAAASKATAAAAAAVLGTLKARLLSLVAAVSAGATLRRAVAVSRAAVSAGAAAVSRGVYRAMAGAVGVYAALQSIGGGAAQWFDGAVHRVVAGAAVTRVVRASIRRIVRGVGRNG
mgnify:CR=1 FL=1